MHLFTTYQNFNIFHKCFLFDLCCVMMWVVLIDISLLMFIGSLKRIYSLILTVTLSCGMLLLLKRGVWIASLRSYGLPIHNWWLNGQSNKLEFIPCSNLCLHKSKIFRYYIILYNYYSYKNSSQYIFIYKNRISFSDLSWKACVFLWHTLKTLKFSWSTQLCCIVRCRWKIQNKNVKLARSVNVYLLLSLRHISAIDCGFQKSWPWSLVITWI